MSVSAVTSGAEISSLLRGSGLASYQARLVESETEEQQQQTPSIAARTIDAEAFRRALSQQIDEDVEAGKISREDAAKVRQSLGLDDEGSDEPAQGGAEGGLITRAEPAAAASIGGPASQAANEPAEISRTQTILDGVQTTSIAYDDGTIETEVTYSTSPDTPQIPFIASAYGQEDAGSYLLTIAHGAFVDVRA